MSPESGDGRRPPPPIQADRPAGPSIFDRIGGHPAVDRLVEAFYRRMESLPEAAAIRSLHPPDLGETKAVLKRYFAEWLGGPRDYSSQRGHPRLRMRHAPFRIGAAERDAWLLCMRGALEEAILSAPLREALYSRLAALADHMRNHEPRQGG